jgi:DNA-binding transcriptional LysR family regulator
MWRRVDLNVLRSKNLRKWNFLLHGSRKFMQLTLKQVRYFLAAAETGQFSVAATRMHVTQTAVTAAIHELEACLGVLLFERHHASGVSLTLEGQRFRLHAQDIVTAVNGAMSANSQVDRQTQGRLRIGATHIMLGHYIVPAIARFGRAYPRIDLDLVEMPRSRIEEALVYGELDAGVLWLNNLENTRDLNHVVVAHSRRQFWASAEHPLLKKRALSLFDLKDEPYALVDVDEVEKSTLAFWALQGLKPNIRFRSSSIEAVRSMVAFNMGITILGDVVYKPWSREGLKIEARPLIDGLPSIEVGLVYKKDAPSNPCLDALKGFLKLAIGLDAAAVATRAD